MRKLAKKTITADTSTGTQSDRMETMRTSRLGARSCRAGAGSRVREDPLAGAPRAGEEGAGAAVKPESGRATGGDPGRRWHHSGPQAGPRGPQFGTEPDGRVAPRAAIGRWDRTERSPEQTCGPRRPRRCVRLIMSTSRSSSDDKLRHDNTTLVALFLCFPNAKSYCESSPHLSLARSGLAAPGGPRVQAKARGFEREPSPTVCSAPGSAPSALHPRRFHHVRRHP